MTSEDSRESRKERISLRYSLPIVMKYYGKETKSEHFRKQPALLCTVKT